MERLYRLASDLYGLRPWRVLDEDTLIVVRDSVSGELCHCSVMGARSARFFPCTAISGQRGFASFARSKPKRSPTLPSCSADSLGLLQWVPGTQNTRRDAACVVYRSQSDVTRPLVTGMRIDNGTGESKSSLAGITAGVLDGVVIPVCGG